MDTLSVLHQNISKDTPEDEKENILKNVEIMRKVIFKNARDVKESNVEPYEYDEVLNKLYNEAEVAYRNVLKAEDEVKSAEKRLKEYNSKANKSVLSAVKSALTATKAVYTLKLKQVNDRARKESETAGRGIGKVKLKGRGLKGAGRAHLSGQVRLEGVVRKGRTYNLNDIQGMATPSAYIYKPLGSKCIRIPDLDAGSLVIVQPNRRKIGPKRGISNDLQKMLKDLVYEKNIEQSEYDQLTTEDKQIFKETLAATHLQHNLREKLADPLDSLKAEYFKLKGEIELGNDNPSIIKQLKVITVDMYSNRLISDDEFKNIIVRLI